MTPAPAPISALLLLASSCPHCPAVLHSLGEMVKSGTLGRVEVVNIAAHPEVAAALGARSVPWLRLGPFELTGLRGRAELEEWVRRAADPAGMADYFHTLLKEGGLEQVKAAIARQPELLAALLPVLANPEASINVRLGASVIFESLVGSETLRQQVPALSALAAHADARVRVDACFYLGLSGDPAARPALELAMDDAAADVAEAAAEALLSLPDSPSCAG